MQRHDATNLGGMVGKTYVNVPKPKKTPTARPPPLRMECLPCLVFARCPREPRPSFPHEPIPASLRRAVAVDPEPARRLSVSLLPHGHQGHVQGQLRTSHRTCRRCSPLIGLKPCDACLLKCSRNQEPNQLPQHRSQFGLRTGPRTVRGAGFCCACGPVH